ncbi:MAG: hypothetical protein K2G91_09275, partial [Prevotella sp.]|nr:hypothetical protein [Prevotella sp.]
MAVNEILFKALPFRPERNQVFYVENGYDGEVNNFIRCHYEQLKYMFGRIGLDFYYLPYLLREHNIEAKVRYYAPYLSPKLLVQKVQSNAFVPYISDSEVKATLKPSFIFEGRQGGYLGNVRFLAVAYDKLINQNIDLVEQLMYLILSTREAYYKEEQERRLQEVQMYELEKHSVCCVLEENMSYNIPMFCPSAASADDRDDTSVRECKRLEEPSPRREKKSSSKKEGMLGRLF